LRMGLPIHTGGWRLGHLQSGGGPPQSRTLSRRGMPLLVHGSRVGWMPNWISFRAWSGAKSQPARRPGLVALRQLDGSAEQLPFPRRRAAWRGHPGVLRGCAAASSASAYSRRVWSEAASMMALWRGGADVIDADRITAGQEQSLSDRVLQLPHVPGHDCDCRNSIAAGGSTRFPPGARRCICAGNTWRDRGCLPCARAGAAGK